MNSVFQFTLPPLIGVGGSGYDSAGAARQRKRAQAVAMAGGNAR